MCAALSKSPMLRGLGYCINKPYLSSPLVTLQFSWEITQSFSNRCPRLELIASFSFFFFIFILFFYFLLPEIKCTPNKYGLLTLQCILFNQVAVALSREAIEYWPQSSESSFNLINFCHTDYARRSRRGNSAHRHPDLVCHTFTTVANRVCSKNQVLCQADKVSAQDLEWTGSLCRSYLSLSADVIVEKHFHCTS